jgi:hypothetical protein
MIDRAQSSAQSSGQSSGRSSGQASGQASTRADREEQLTAEFRPLACRQCSTAVLVRKSSPHQTSVQWQSEAATSCPFLASRAPSAPLVESCPALSESIRAAVEGGQIPSGRT